jgi:hypothetical protein
MDSLKQTQKSHLEITGGWYEFICGFQKILSKIRKNEHLGSKAKQLVL